MNVCHVLLHHGSTEGLTFEVEDLAKCGLIQTEAELDILKQIGTCPGAKIGKWYAVILWVGRLFKKCVDNGNIDKVHSMEFYSSLKGLRKNMIGLANQNRTIPPLSWAVTMFLIIKLQCLLFALGYAGESPPCEHYFAIPFVNTVVMCVAFGFVLRLCEALADRPILGEPTRMI